MRNVIKHNATGERAAVLVSDARQGMIPFARVAVRRRTPFLTASVPSVVARSGPVPPPNDLVTTSARGLTPCRRAERAQRARVRRQIDALAPTCPAPAPLTPRGVGAGSFWR